MTDYRLIRQQKNDVLAALTQHNLDPASFAWADERVSEAPYAGFRTVSRITHVPSAYYAKFDYLSVNGNTSPTSSSPPAATHALAGIGAR